MARFVPVLGLAIALSPGLFAQLSTKLSAQTTRAFNDYQQKAEASFNWRGRYNTLRAGEVRIDPVRDDGSVDVKDGIIHDWVAATLVPGATARDVIGLLQDYAAYKTHYTPQVMESKVLSHAGPEWRVFLKMMKKQILTVILNGEFDITYRDLGGGRWAVVSRSTKIAEINEDENRELPVGTGRGFLWRLNAYWLIEDRPSGVYIECRSLSLSRDIPFGFGLVIGRFVTRVPRESLQDTMDATLRALNTAVAARRENPAVAQQEVGQ
jgi:hypothetical protein